MSVRVGFWAKLKAMVGMFLFSGGSSLIHSAASSGEPFSQDLVASQIHEGVFMPKDDQVARILWRSAAEKGHVRALTHYGMACLTGVGGERNHHDARIAFERAVKNGRDPVAMTCLATMYKDGAGVAKDVERAVALLEDAIGEGSQTAPRILGKMLYEGVELPRDLDEAERVFKVGMDAGDSVCTLYLGRIERRRGNYAGARRYFKDVAHESGSMIERGIMLYLGEGCEIDHEGARKLFERARRLGDYEACHWLGRLFMDEEYRGFDLDRAMAYLGEGECHRNPGCIGKVGFLYARGLGVRANPEMAFVHFRMGAGLGDAYSAYALGTVYARGLLGQGRNLKEARKWLERAAEDELTESYAVLGDVLRGLGENGAAHAWYKRGAEASDPECLKALGDMYLDGGTEEQDPAMAESCYRMSWDLGCTAAGVRLGELWLSEEDGAGRKKALAMFSECAGEDGDGGISLEIAGILREEGMTEGWRRYLKRAADLGNPAALQEYRRSLSEGRMQRKRRDGTCGRRVDYGCSRRSGRIVRLNTRLRDLHGA